MVPYIIAYTWKRIAYLAYLRYLYIIYILYHCLWMVQFARVHVYEHMGSRWGFVHVCSLILEHDEQQRSFGRVFIVLSFQQLLGIGTKCYQNAQYKLHVYSICGMSTARLVITLLFRATFGGYDHQPLGNGTRVQSMCLLLRGWYMNILIYIYIYNRYCMASFRMMRVMPCPI